MVGDIYRIGMVVMIQRGVATKPNDIENKLVKMVLNIVEVVVNMVIRLNFI